MQGIDGVFYVVILIISVIMHEVAHGLAADHFGDPTARLSGRLSLNPIRHIDPFGSVILPLLLIFSGTGVVVGWAKPVPYNPNLMRNQRFGVPAVALAGIVTNLCIALFFGIVIRLGMGSDFLSQGFFHIASTIVLVNLVLALFNVLPLPPLDGFRLIFSLIPRRLRRYEQLSERYGIFLLILFILFGWRFVAPLVIFLYSFFTGIHL
ncbi:MAG TPA: site-2 protease family protein [Candidatus Paceibacterota bacterium]|nr:site-2 protease family protein [Candidatus Paceibacterota bacterium]